MTQRQDGQAVATLDDKSQVAVGDRYAAEIETPGRGERGDHSDLWKSRRHVSQRQDRVAVRIDFGPGEGRRAGTDPLDDLQRVARGARREGAARTTDDLLIRLSGRRNAADQQHQPDRAPGPSPDPPADRRRIGNTDHHVRPPIGPLRHCAGEERRREFAPQQYPGGPAHSQREFAGNSSPCTIDRLLHFGPRPRTITIN